MAEQVVGGAPAAHTAGHDSPSPHRTMTIAAGRRASGQRRAPSGASVVLLTFVFALALAALGYVGYVLWPRWPDAAATPDAPPLPIIVAGTLFNVQPAAIRIAVQRRAGAQDRIDLVYMWPSLAPPDDGDKEASKDNSKPSATAASPDRIFVTIAPSAGALPPGERLKSIYPRYLASGAATAVEGLTVAPFRDGSPYQGEDLVFDPVAPANFILRCNRSASDLTPATCLHERFIEGANVTMRFPREWLPRWRSVSPSMDRLIARWRPASR